MTPRRSRRPIFVIQQHAATTIHFDFRLEPDEAVADGELKFRLHGEKRAGGYLLVRTGGSGRECWLLINQRGDEADARRRPTRTQPESVFSGTAVPRTG